MREKYYVIKSTKGNYYSTKEGWTKDIYKAWNTDETIEQAYKLINI